MEVNNDQEFVIARLKEEVFNITEQNIWDNSTSERGKPFKSTYQLSEVPWIGSEYRFDGFQLHQAVFSHLGRVGQKHHSF